MNYDTVCSKELSNTGQHIHCHYHPESNTWIAYGKSAYALHKLIKDSGFHYIDKFSTESNMVSVMAGAKTMTNICSNNVVEHKDDGYMCLHYDVTWSDIEYCNWECEVKDSSDKKNHQWVQTIVSNELSKDEFIADGMSSLSRNTKRIIDFIASTVAIIIFSPLFLVTYIMVRLEDGGPAIFKQERIGRFGKPFYIYKFRSMRVDAEKYGPQLSHSGGENDPRLTRVGQFIRRHHLDELPQLWNVWCGDMAFIGPRPERKFYIDQIMEFDKRYVYLYQIRPGVTSYATLYNGYTDTMEKMLKRLEFDLYYLEHRSWLFDIKILFNTFCAIVFGKKF